MRRVVEIIAELQSLMVLEGDDATFKCMVSPEDVVVTWQLDGRPVVPSERLQVARSGLCHSLTVRGCQPSDAATVTANAEGLLSTARLSVQGKQDGDGAMGHLKGCAPIPSPPQRRRCCLCVSCGTWWQRSSRTCAWRWR